MTVDGQEVGGHPLTNLPAPGEVTTTSFFPDFPNKKFPVGEVVRMGGCYRQFLACKVVESADGWFAMCR